MFVASLSQADPKRPLTFGVQKVLFGSIVLKNSTSDWLGACSWVVDARVDEGLEASCGHNWRRDGNQLGQFPQILRRGGEEELVAGAGGTA